MSGGQNISHGFDGLRIGDLVRLRSGDGEGSTWTVIGRSFGSVTVDLVSDDAGAASKFRYGVKPTLLERIDATFENGLPNKRA